MIHRPRNQLSICTVAWLYAGCSESFLSKRQVEFEDPAYVSEAFVQSPLPQADILWIIDNTPSMEQKLEALSAALPSFIGDLNDSQIAWQMGFVTAEPSDEMGILRGTPWIWTPQDQESLGEFLAATGLAPDGLEPSTGLAAMLHALTPPLADGPNAGFRRPDASLHVVVVSDSDDQSLSVHGTDAAEDATEWLLNEQADSGRQVRFSALVGPPNGCSGPNGTALPGDQYAAVAEATSGDIESICDTDFEGVSSALSAASLEWPTVFPLQTQPRRDTLRVTIDNQRQDAGWVLLDDPPAIAFDSPPRASAEIEVRYQPATQ